MISLKTLKVMLLATMLFGGLFAFQSVSSDEIAYKDGFTGDSFSMHNL